MFISKQGIKIGKTTNNLIDISNMLVEVKYGYNKLWSQDSGRNLAGKQSGTLIGIFPKIICQFRKLTKEEFETIRPIIDAPKQVIRYYDPKQGWRNMSSYTGDYEMTNKSIVGTNGHKNEPFSVSFIAISKRP